MNGSAASGQRVEDLVGRDALGLGFVQQRERPLARFAAAADAAAAVDEQRLARRLGRVVGRHRRQLVGELAGPRRRQVVERVAVGRRRRIAPGVAHTRVM